MQTQQMPEATPNITKIPAPRVALLDQRTGLISREWFRFFNNIYVLTGGENQGVTQIVNGGTGSSTAEGARQNIGAGTVNRVLGSGTVNGLTLIGDVTNEGEITLTGELADVNLATQTIGLLDVSTQVRGVLSLTNGGTGVAVTGISTYTTDFTVGDFDLWVINNKSTGSCVATLPDATTSPGRSIIFKNLQSQTLVSASSNVVPLTGGAAGTAILPATPGAWATLVSDGTNWVIMQS